MPALRVIRNEGISNVILAVPEGHRHLRLALTTKDGYTVVLQEAAVAAIVRAYTAVKAHPVRSAVKLVSTPLDQRKKGYAEHQLIEADAPDAEVEKEMTALLSI